MEALTIQVKSEVKDVLSEGLKVPGDVSVYENFRSREFEPLK